MYVETVYTLRLWIERPYPPPAGSVLLIMIMVNSDVGKVHRITVTAETTPFIIKSYRSALSVSPSRGRLLSAHGAHHGAQAMDSRVTCQRLRHAPG